RALPALALPGALPIYLANVLAHPRQAIADCRRGDDGRAVLVIVEDRDVHPLGELALDVEALRGFDVLQIDAAQRRLQRRDDVDQDRKSTRLNSSHVQS